jgi:hypothetical protein
MYVVYTESYVGVLYPEVDNDGRKKLNRRRLPNSSEVLLLSHLDTTATNSPRDVLMGQIIDGGTTFDDVLTAFSHTYMVKRCLDCRTATG